MLWKPSEKVWWLVDCNSFFASCEVMRRPERKGKCVCVWWDIIVAATYEAKAFGIRTGTPMREAKKMLPKDVIYCKPDFAHYKEISNQIMSLLHSLANKTEVFSIDEAFIDITWWDKKYDLSYSALAQKLQQKILKEIGIPTSIWIGPTRLLAKMFADFHKPLWYFVALDKESIVEALAWCKLGDIPFIGRKSHARWDYLCSSAKGFALLDYSLIKQRMWRSWLKIWWELNGYSMFYFDRQKKPQSIVRTRSFNPRFTNDAKVIRSYLLTHIQRAYEQLLYHQTKVKKIRLIMRDKWFARFGWEKILPFPTDDKETILLVARELFEKLPFNAVWYRTAGISFSELSDGRHHQQSLFSNQVHKTTTPLQEILHKVREKCGTDSIKRAVRFQKKRKIRFQ